MRNRKRSTCHVGHQLQKGGDHGAQNPVGTNSGTAKTLARRTQLGTKALIGKILYYSRNYSDWTRVVTTTNAERAEKLPRVSRNTIVATRLYHRGKATASPNTEGSPVLIPGTRGTHHPRRVGRKTATTEQENHRGNATASPNTEGSPVLIPGYQTPRIRSKIRAEFVLRRTTGFQIARLRRQTTAATPMSRPTRQEVHCILQGGGRGAISQQAVSATRDKRQSPGHYVLLAQLALNSVQVETQTAVLDTMVVVFDMTMAVFDMTSVTTTTVHDNDPDTTTSVFDTTTAVFDTMAIVFDPTTIVFDTTTSVFDTTRIVFDTTMTVSDTTRIGFDTTPSVLDTTTIVFNTTTNVSDTTTIVFNTMTIVYDDRV
ncbi:hypothetical protein CBR_g45395 [Chara braunii]|uniref:Uncharacterized protein n=1 Tax=Chara braunii TaxID=69332 RepID=A0A388LYI8_CHABU|nr:hypothetical protein CBR_g45395 [Chara braunii]|eukprot:GBG87335.1 hypothetical protein CBR_g45395 [Chara braunii]